ncbi:MAG: hypothetical protein KA714_23135 [Limnoraphis sp. WC205]|nr:hypothetical protein [Limnoraphis sp. WC205]
MKNSDSASSILKNLESGNWNNSDLNLLRQILQDSDRNILEQLGKYNVSIREGKEIHIGDRTYNQWDETAIQAIVRAIQEQIAKIQPSTTENIFNISGGTIGNITGSGTIINNPALPQPPQNLHQ